MASQPSLVADSLLQDALSIQNKAHADFMASHGLPNRSPAATNNETNSSDDGLTLTVLGCGTMGIAILGGILDSLSSSDKQSKEDDAATPAKTKLPNKFYACVRRKESARRIANELGHYPKCESLTISENDNLQPCQAADVILLGCKPQMVGDILKAEGMAQAVKGKLVISICAGVPESQIASYLPEENWSTVVRAMPNTAAAVRESMTVIGTLPSRPLDAPTTELLTWIFSRIGRVTYLPSANMDAVTALCGSGPAFCAVVVESLAAGAIAMSVPRDEAYLMAAQTMRGTTGLLLEKGEHPAILRDKVSTPGGCTIGGLLVLEEGGLRGTVSRAVREATVVASQLGQGKQGVNGTRQI